MGRMKIQYDDDGEYITKRDETALESMEAVRKAAEFDNMTDEEYWRY